MTRSNFNTPFIFILFVLMLFPSWTQAGVVVINGLTHLHDVVPGETYRGQIEVQNTNNTEQAVRLYKRDYSFNNKEESFYEDPGTLERSNATWIDISPSYLILKPKEKNTISYEIKVPEALETTGTYWSVIMVEGETPVDSNQLNNGLTVKTQIRYAVQVATTFNRQGNRNLTFMDVHIEQEEGQPYLLVDIINDGDFMFKPDVTIELFDLNGLTMGVFSGLKKKIYPTTSTRYKIGLEGISAGKYTALLLADCGEEDVFGMNLDLAIKNE